MLLEPNRPSLSLIAGRSRALWDALSSGLYGTRLSRLACGAQLVEAGGTSPGSFEAGRLAAELAQGGLASARLGLARVCALTLPVITVETFFPAAACLDLQMAEYAEGVMLSGPLRLFLRPPRFVDMDTNAAGAEGAMVALVQAQAPVTDEWAESLARRAGIDPARLRLVWVPEDSVAGSTQICGRMNESILLTLVNSQERDPHRPVHLLGSCPVCPVLRQTTDKSRLLPDDFLHYLAQCHLTYDAAPGEDLQALAEGLCFRSAPAYGALFADLLEQAGGDFFKIPDVAHINKLAAVTVNELTSGRVCCAGRPEPERLAPCLACPGQAPSPFPEKEAAAL